MARKRTPEEVKEVEGIDVDKPGVRLRVETMVVDDHKVLVCDKCGGDKPDTDPECECGGRFV